MPPSSADLAHFAQTFPKVTPQPGRPPVRRGHGRAPLRRYRWSLSPPKNAEADPKNHDVGKLNSINRAQFDDLGTRDLPILSKPATMQGLLLGVPGFYPSPNHHCKKKNNSKSDWWFHARNIGRWADQPDKKECLEPTNSKSMATDPPIIKHDLENPPFDTCFSHRNIHFDRFPGTHVQG